MTETETIKKKKKRLSLTFSDVPTGEILSTEAVLYSRLLNKMRYHLGKENAISIRELFKDILNIDPINLDIYRVQFWYNIIKKLISHARKSNECFIINNGSVIYVLHTTEEALKFNSKIDRTIKGLEELKSNALKWVEGKKYIEFINPKGKTDKK